MYTPNYASGGKAAWQNNSSTPITYTALDNIETQYTEATNSFNPDLFNPAGYSLVSFAPAKDGVQANKLNLAAGVAYVPQADSTLRRRAPGVGTSLTTSVANTTYYAALNADGSWYWSTTSGGAYAIARVTTDGSGNISTVTDTQFWTINLFPNAAAPNTLQFAGKPLAVQVTPLSANSTTDLALTTSATAVPGASVTITTPGTYFVSMTMDFDPAGAAGTLGLMLGQLYQNSGSVFGLAISQPPAGSSFRITASQSYLLTCAANDVLSLKAYNSIAAGGYARSGDTRLIALFQHS